MHACCTSEFWTYFILIISKIAIAIVSFLGTIFSERTSQLQLDLVFDLMIYPKS